MEINKKNNISVRSKIHILIAKFFMPDVSKLVLPAQAFVSNDEMYALPQDRPDTNPSTFHPRDMSKREVIKRNILVSLIRRQLWKRGNTVGAVVFIASTVFWGIANLGVYGVKNAAHKIEESRNEAKQLADQKQQLKSDILNLKTNCEAGKLELTTCTNQMNDLRKRYEKLN